MGWLLQNILGWWELRDKDGVEKKLKNEKNHIQHDCIFISYEKLGQKL